jgi:hypothetical protein
MTNCVSHSVKEFVRALGRFPNALDNQSLPKLEMLLQECIERNAELRS